ncbi:MAG: imidazolonepropionase-like amidohydrolase/Tol biopolymer transport system component [Enterobacterales bacterium]|jgi:imidazolonepropionase-like amidohydrolase/Tol biopolymer transport system component
MYKLSVIIFSIVIASMSSLFLNLTILAAEPLANLEADRAVQKAKDKEEKWDVNNPPYKTHAIPIDVRSGTWMNLDVSPDGKEIIFDMLGDLYRLPINGGEAEAITSTISWEMQPRFSPDGKSIAYTSDAAGGDNIWVMLKDGSEARALSSEKFRLLNSPAWSPDSRFIVARKHFSSARSLGAGELWLYSVDGKSSGVQLNEKPTLQKDLGEPAFSVDGRYVYFSEDVTPGPVFEYSKDSNGIIYGIKRLDTQSGDISNYIRSPGGSVRPTPSPDGNWLAYVRRVENKTGLYIKNIQSGNEQLLCDCLERDMQETWAIHGVYPNIDWMPDSKELVFWAKGKIHRLDIDSKKSTEIPFHIKHSRQVAEAVRFKNKVFQETEHTKMLRWVTVSADQTKVVYQTLGQLYVRDLNSGKIKQLTKGKEDQAFYPSLSSDGKWVTYVSWNDQSLGKIKKISITGGRSKTIISEPGHYLEPRFSSNDKTIVYQKVRGGYLLSPDWSVNSGLYEINANGKGQSEKLNVAGTAVQFAKDGRYYLTNVEGSGKTRKARLIAFDKKSGKQQIVAETHFGSEFSISPDSKWLAYVEGFNVYVTPFRVAGKVIKLGSGNPALPVMEVSEDAGENIHWSADSTKLHWSMGETLFTQEVSKALFADGLSDEDKGKNKAQSRSIGFDYKAALPTQVVALINARIITMESDEVIESGTILVENNRIKAVSDSASISIPKAAKIIDLSGKTIMPGIIDAHWHGSQAQNEIVPRENWKNLASLAFGVTTVHDPSNDTSEIFAASEMAKAGEIVAPRIYSTGRIIYGAKASIFAEVNNLDDARKHVKRMKAAGAFSVKSYNQPRREQRQQIMQAGIEENILVMPEGGSLFQHNMNMIIDGHTGIEHSIPVANVYDDVLQLWSQTNVGYTPTLVVGYGGLWGELYWYQHSNVWQHPILSKWVPTDLLRQSSVRRPMAPEEDYNHFNNAKIANKLHDLGVELHIGAHGQREGLGAHWEMWMFAQGGMKPMDVLKVATIEGAEYLGMSEEIGSIKVGKLADLMILDINPLENIYATDKVHSVMINGRLFKADTMEELTGDWKPKKLYWQK